MKINSKTNLIAVSSSALAAGVAHGAVVYQYYNQTIAAGNGQSLTFDLNQDGFADFSVSFSSDGEEFPTYLNPNQKPFVVSDINSSGSTTNYVLANSPILNPNGLPVTPAGTTIDGSYESPESTGYFYLNSSGSQEGSWDTSGNIEGYVGLELTDSSNNTYFGWAQFVYNQTNVLGGFPGTITLVDTGFETQPGVGILAGQTAELGSAPSIFIPPHSQTNYIGATAQLTAISTGDSPLAYQWLAGATGSGTYTNLTDGGNMVGSSSNVLTINNFSSFNAGDYVVVVSNSNGSVTSSAPATMTAAPALVSTLYPSPARILSGGSVTLAITNYGSSVPVSFYWQKDGAALSDGGEFSGSAGPKLTISPVSAADAANYTVVLTNTYGSITSAVDAVTVTMPSNPYAQALYSLHPLAYWPLAETNGAVAYDVVGGYNGSYIGGVTLGQGGVASPNFGSPSYAAQFSGTGYVEIPDSTNFNLTGPVSSVVWVEIPSAPGQLSGLLSHGGNSWNMTINRFPTAFQASGEGPSALGNSFPSAAKTTATITSNQWHMVVYTYSGVPNMTNNGLLYLDGQLAGSQTLPIAPLPAATAENWTNVDVWIGGAPDQGVRPGAGNNELFTGSLANAALFANALTGSQVQALYALSVGSVFLTIQSVPGSTNVVVTWPVGTLLQAQTLAGPWTTNSAAASPYTNAATASQMFFKVVVPGL